MDGLSADIIYSVFELEDRWWRIGRRTDIEHDDKIEFFSYDDDVPCWNPRRAAAALFYSREDAEDKFVRGGLPWPRQTVRQWRVKYHNFTPFLTSLLTRQSRDYKICWEQEGF